MTAPEVAAPSWPARVIAVATPVADVARGRAAEFRQRGILLESTPSVAAALISIGQDPRSVALVPTDLRDMPLLDFLDVVRAFSTVPVIVGLASAYDNETVAAALDRGSARAVRLPVSADALAHAIDESRGRSIPPAEPEAYHVGDLELDRASYRVHWHGEEVHLAPRLFEMLRYFAAAHPRVVSLEELVSEFGATSGPRDPGERVRVMIGRIRAQLVAARPDLPPPLETVHRVGYRLTE
jgi:two-component system KDP operon response regulator KdpE